MAKHAVIGGTGLTELEGLETHSEQAVETPFGDPSCTLITGHFADLDVVFLPRHGTDHRFPPHRINYRANIWALKSVGVKNVIAVNAVGAIRADLQPGALVIPHNLIDYTWGRDHTFFDGEKGNVGHVDFSQPYSGVLREALCRGAGRAGIEVASKAVYGITQGPRLESAAEIDRMESDGCDVVGMTGMPEAGLARELALEYATCTVVSNRAAGRGAGDITMDEIRANLATGMGAVRKLLAAALPMLEQ